jgi:signal transduction histidine kinase/DNA-binding response OmpR family regulator
MGVLLSESVKKSILLVEDDEADQTLFEALLSDIQNPLFSYDIKIVSTMEEALGVLEGAMFDLVFLDLGLPGYTGLKTVEKIIDHVHSPLIVLTNNSDKELAQDVIQEGAQDYLVKGEFSPEQLDRTIMYALERHALSRNLLETQALASLGSWEIFKNSHVMMFSPQVFKILEIEEKKNPSLEDFIAPYAPHEGMRLKSLMEEALDSGQSFRTVLSIKRDYGEQYVEIISNPDFNAENEVISIHGSLQDITEKKRLEEKKDQFVSTVTHELRTPLAVMKGVMVNLDQGLAGDLNEKQLELITMGIHQSDRLGRIIDNLLDMSRLESRRVSLNQSVVNLNDLITSHIQEYAQKEHDENVKIQTNLSDSLPSVFVDQDTIIQVMNNLLSNAQRYAKSCITVETKVVDDDVQVSVIDDGPGIPEDGLSLVFDKFAQVKRMKGGSEYRGTGLGLPVCKEIVSKHHGKIWVESEFGQGSQFHFVLPQYDRDRALLSKFEEAKLKAKNHADSFSVFLLTNPTGDDFSLVKMEDELYHKVLRDEDILFLDLEKKQLFIFAQTIGDGALRLKERIGEHFQEAYSPQVQIVSYPQDGKTMADLFLKLC